MTGPFVIDTSVFLNAFNPAENGSAISKELLRRLRTQAVPLIAPTLLLPETAAAISRGQNNPDWRSSLPMPCGVCPILSCIPGPCFWRSRRLR